MRALIRSLISDALMDMSTSSLLACQFRLETFQSTLERAVDHEISGANHGAAQQRRINRVLHAHPALQSACERRGEFVRLSLAQRDGGDDLHVDGVFDGGAFALVMGRDLRQK